MQYGENSSIREECLMPFSEWTPPNTNEIRSAMKMASLTGSAFANMVGVKNSRTVRRWTGGEVEIPYAAWAILCYQAGFGVIWKV